MAVSLDKKLKTTTQYIPHEIIYSGILTRLPVKSLFRFRCVSKLWNATITDPDFIKSHSLCAQQNSTSSILGLYRIQTKDKKNWGYKFFTKDAPRFFSFRVTKATKLIGQCNGLFCFRSRRHFMICNPCTREFLWYRLPPRPPRHHPVSYGFGFDSLTREYKLVQIVHANRKFYRCMLYTMGAKSNHSCWREIAVSVNLSQHFSWCRISEDSDIGGTVNSGRAVFINGTFFWFFRQPHLFMSFDLHFEKFDFVQGPIPTFRYAYYFDKPDCLCFLMELQGCLCLAFQYDDDEGDTVQLYRYGSPRANHWDLMLFNLPYKPILQVGALGAESLLYSLTSKDVMVYNLEGIHDDECLLIGSKLEKLPSLQGVDHSIVSEYGFSYHVENLDSLKSLLGSSPAQARYVKDRN